MTERFDSNSYSAFTSPSKPLSWKKARKIIGRIGFAVGLLQLLFGVSSTLLFLLAIINRRIRISLGVDFSLFCVWCGLILLAISIYTAFSYSRIAGKLTKSNISLSKKTSIAKKLKIATMINSTGALVSFIGVEIILGVMFSIVLLPNSGSLFHDYSQFPFVSFTDVLTISAAANLTAAHCVGLVGSLWALNKIEKVNY